MAVLTLALCVGACRTLRSTGSSPPSTAAADSRPPIGIIEVYGARRVSEERIREALQIKEGDALPLKSGEVEQRVAAILGVRQVHLNTVCCDAGKSILYVGIQESGAGRLVFRAAPTGSIRLPEEIVQAGQALDRALMEAVQRGDAEEDPSQGYSLARNPDARAIQQRFIGFAAHDGKLLADVLRFSGDAEHRARAAEIIAYTTNKEAAVSDLIHATRDPSPGVRNEAVRALALIAAFAQRHPEGQLRVPWTPLIDLLNSVVWTDRNKASFALMQLSEGRDPELLSELKSGALPALVEMARWKSRAHALPSFVILGRIAGMNDDAIFKAWEGGRHQSIIESFQKPNHE